MAQNSQKTQEKIAQLGDQVAQVDQNLTSHKSENQEINSQLIEMNQTVITQNQATINQIGQLNSLMNRGFANVDEGIANVSARVDQVEAQHWNLLATTYNVSCERTGRRYRPFKKAKIGLGEPIPRSNGARITLSNLPTVTVGDVIPAEYFPATPNAASAMTHETIDALSVIMNEDFGIASQDSINIRKRKVMYYITHYDVLE